MKRALILTCLFALLSSFSKAQVLNQNAGWPNEDWSITGSYNSDYLYENPTIIGGSSLFSFDDDDAGSLSINTIAAASPIIDLTGAFSTNQTDIVVYFQYVLNIFEDETLRLQYLDADHDQWTNWGSEIVLNTNFGSDFCGRTRSEYTSNLLSITNFSTNQLANFRYRILYNDNLSHGWGFCIDSPTISSSEPTACPAVTNLTMDNVTYNSAQINWMPVGSESFWEIALRLASETIPESGATIDNVTYNLTDLSPETDYTFYVRADCGIDGFSDWENVDFTTSEDLTEYPVTFTTNSINTTETYDIALVDLNGDFLDDVVSVGLTNINLHYQLISGGFNAVNIPTANVEFIPSWSLAAGDFDGNGYNDLLYGDWGGVTFIKANNAGTAFTAMSGIESVFSQRSNFVDINNDGYLDAFVCNDLDPNVYYINDGSGNLNFYQGESEGIVPNGLGLIPGGGNYGTVWVDYDNDRDMDLFIAKCRGGSTIISTNELWRNDGNGIFINVADSNGWYNSNYPSVGHNNSSNLGDEIQTWSSAWADFDNDGDMDVYVGASSASNGDSKLMRNNGDGTFTDVTAGSGVLDAQLGIENAPADFDNDGFVDILSNGNILFNGGDLTFTNYSTNVPPTGAIGDANNDGFLDVFRSGNIYINNTNANNWIKINTVGVASNYNGIGARIQITTATGTQIRDVRSGEGFEFMSSLNTHFGLGPETSINNITIYWPSGIIDNIANPAINTTHNIVEGSTLSLEDETLANLSVYPNPVEAMLQINTVANLTNKIATIFDINGKRVINLKLKSKTSIDVSSLESGTYFLRLESRGKSIKRKFIKK